MPCRARERRGSDADTTTDTAARRTLAVRHRRFAESEARDVTNGKSITNDVRRPVGVREPVSLAGSVGLAERLAVTDRLRISEP